MAVCSTVSWFLLSPLWKSALPGYSPIFYSIVGYVSILAVLFALSKMNKVPLFGVFSSFAGDILLKVWFSIGIIILAVSIFCVL